MRGEHPSTVIDGLGGLLEHEAVHFGKMVASLMPVIVMLTSGHLEGLLSPDETDPNDPRRAASIGEIIARREVLYVGLDSLSDPKGRLPILGEPLPSGDDTDATPSRSDRSTCAVGPVAGRRPDAAHPGAQPLRMLRPGKARLRQTFCNLADRDEEAVGLACKAMKPQTSIERGSVIVLCIHDKRIDRRFCPDGAGNGIDDKDCTQTLLLMTTVNGQAPDQSGRK